MLDDQQIPVKPTLSTVKPRLAISCLGKDQELKARYMIDHIKRLYPDPDVYSFIFNRILELRTKSLKSGKVSQEEYGRLLSYYMLDHSEAWNKQRGYDC